MRVPRNCKMRVSLVSNEMTVAFSRFRCLQKFVVSGEFRGIELVSSPEANTGTFGN